MTDLEEARRIIRHAKIIIVTAIILTLVNIGVAVFVL